MAKFGDLYETCGAPIGKGGAADVYECRPLATHRHHPKVALVSKHLKDTTNGREKRFDEEANFLRRLSHPNLLTLFDYFEEDKVMVLERASFSLQECMDIRTFKHPSSRQTLDTPAKLKVLHQVAAGLAHLHLHGVVHRDLAPSNILIRPDGSAAIADLGMSTVGAVELPDDRLGNPKTYAPEEQARRLRDAGPAADVFAFGLIAYSLLTGAIPRGHPFFTVGEYQPEVPLQVSETLHQCLFSDPQKRPTAEKLEEVLSFTGASATELILRKQHFSEIRNLPSSFSSFFGVGELTNDLGFDIEKEVIRTDYRSSLDFFGIAFRNLASQEVMDKIRLIGNARILLPNTNCEPLMIELAEALLKSRAALENDVDKSIELLSGLRAEQGTIQIRTYDVAPPWRMILVDQSMLLQRVYGGDRANNLLLKVGDGRYLRRVGTYFASVWDRQSHELGLG